MRHAELRQPGDGRSEAFDDPTDDRPGAGNGHLLADDRPDAHLEGIPGAGDAEPRQQLDTCLEQGIAPERCSSRGEVEVEIEQAPDLLHDVDQTAPVRQMRREQQVVGAAARNLDDARVAVDQDRPAIQAVGDLLDAADCSRGEITEHGVPVQGTGKGEA